MSFLLTRIELHRSPMEAALARKARRGAEQVRLHFSYLANNRPTSHLWMTFHIFNTLSDLDNNIVGVCNYICCNTTTQETCYAWDDSGNILQSCALIADGGCPCPDGYEKCGAGKIQCLPWRIAVHSLLILCPFIFLRSIRPK